MKARSIVVLGVMLGCYQTIELTPIGPDATVPDPARGDASPSDDRTPACPDTSSPARTEWTATLPVAEDGCITQRPVGERCLLRLDPPSGASLTTWCTAALGRTPTLTEPGRCDVTQIGSTGAPMSSPAPGSHGHYLVDGSGGACAYRVVLTDETTGRLRNASLRCALREDGTASLACPPVELGASCALPLPATCVFGGAACAATAPTVLSFTTPQCRSNLCASQQAGGATTTFCTCLCAGNPRGADCTCGTGMTCAGAAEVFFSGEVHAVRYCVPAR